MNALKKYTDSFENTLEVIATPIKPFLPVIARFLLVVTFLEDSFRIISQWSEQVVYLQRYRGFLWISAELFLGVNVLTMLICSCLAIGKKYTPHAVCGLFGVVLSQSLGYGLIFDYNFFFRSYSNYSLIIFSFIYSLSVVGGLLMLLADSFASKKKSIFAGIPSMSETDRSMYLQLAGRVLLVFLFLSFILAGEFSVLRAIVSFFALIGCVMVVIGFKAKYSAWILITFLSIGNVLLNNWWNLHQYLHISHILISLMISNHPQRDFMKYDFFQTLSIMGGFLLLINLGPGGISMDEKKKDY